MLLKIKNLLQYNDTRKVVSRERVNITKLINSVLQIIGLSSYTTSYRVHWATNVAAICFLISNILQVITLFVAKNDPAKLFECFSVFSFCVMGGLKLISLRKNQKSWCFLLTQITVLEKEQLNDNTTINCEYHSDDEDTDGFPDFINMYTEKFKRFSTILIRIYAFTATIFILSPFVELIVCKLWDGMECVAYPHILPGWAPLDDLSILGYIVTVSCEFIAAVYCVSVHTALDMTAIGIMIFVCGQYYLLQNYSARIAGKGKRCNISKKRDDRARYRIKKCHRINNLLVTSMVELDKLLKNILGVYFLNATLTLCSVAVRLKSEVMSVMQLLTLVQYMCGILTQLFLFCRYGNEVLHESSVIMGQGPYGAALWCISPRVRRDLMMLGAGMMRPRHLCAGPFNYLDLPSFIQVVRTAYSYYAVLGKRESGH